MKTYVSILLLCLVPYFACLAGDTNNYEWGPVAGNFQMSIRLKDGGTTIKTNQPIDLIIRIRNLSTNESLGFTMCNNQELSPSNSSVKVLSPSGKDIYVWRSPLAKDGSFSGTFQNIRVPPQGAYEYQDRAGGFSEAVTNGVYKVVATRKVLHGLTVTSNPLLLKVVPGKWKESDSNTLFP